MKCYVCSLNYFTQESVLLDRKWTNTFFHFESIHEWHRNATVCFSILYVFHVFVYSTVIYVLLKNTKLKPTTKWSMIFHLQVSATNKYSYYDGSSFTSLLHLAIILALISSETPFLVLLYLVLHAFSLSLPLFFPHLPVFLDSFSKRPNHSKAVLFGLLGYETKNG